MICSVLEKILNTVSLRVLKMYIAVLKIKCFVFLPLYQAFNIDITLSIKFSVVIYIKFIYSTTFFYQSVHVE